MTISIAHLGPPGTYAESAALAYADQLLRTTQQQALLCPYPNIAQTLKAVAQQQADIAVVPVENSIEGSVTMTLDTLWQLDHLQIQQALVLPISHALLSWATDLSKIQVVYSHPQALAQCQRWLNHTLASVQLIPTNSTTEALKYIEENGTTAAIASRRAAELYNLPILAFPINDKPNNCTRFWILSLQPSPGGNHTSLAFSVRDVPGALVKPLQIFADQGINLSRIESRPPKQSLDNHLGRYVFFIDLEANAQQESVLSALTALETHTQNLKIFGSYSILSIG